MPRNLNDSPELKNAWGHRLTTSARPMGLLRLYDPDKQLLLAQYVPERTPLVAVDNNLLIHFAAVGTFTPTTSQDEALELRDELDPLFRPEPNPQTPQAAAYRQARYLADLRPDQAGPPYLAPCPECRVGQHELCQGDTVHAKRDKACQRLLADRDAAFDADDGYIVYTSPKRKLNHWGSSAVRAVTTVTQAALT